MPQKHCRWLLRRRNGEWRQRRRWQYQRRQTAHQRGAVHGRRHGTAVTAVTPPVGPVLVDTVMSESTVNPPLQAEGATGAEMLQLTLVGEVVFGFLVQVVV